MRKFNETQVEIVRSNFGEGDNVALAFKTLYGLLFFSTDTHEVDSFCFDVLRKLELSYPNITGEIKKELIFEESSRTMKERARRNAKRGPIEGRRMP